MKQKNIKKNKLHKRNIPIFLITFVLSVSLCVFLSLYLPASLFLFIYIYIYIKLATVVKGDPKASFSKATTPRCRGRRHSFSWIAPLYH